MTGKQMIALYRKNGWTLIRIGKDSHYYMKKGGHIEPVPYHGHQLRNSLEKHLLNVMRKVK
ncbi:MAG: type II toxin-antitoxin system HicA family toxin [Candidatus Xenobiia bacterium LiM19]